MGRFVVRTAAAAALLLGPLAAGSAGAQEQESYPKVQITGRAQEQFYWFDNEAFAEDVGPQSNFFLRRVRLEARGELSERVAFFIQPSFEGGRTTSSTTTCDPVTVPAGGGTVRPECTTTSRGGIRLRDAWIDLRLTPAGTRTALFVRGGQEKRPFSRLELLSSNNLPTIERGAGDGLPFAASNDVFDDLGFMSQDVGASVRLEHALAGEPGGSGARLATLWVGVYNGQGESLDDVNDAKSFGARATASLAGRLDVGASVFSRDRILAADSAFRTTGWGVDAQWSRPGEPGLFALAEYLQGEDATVAKNTVRGGQVLAAWHLRTASPRGLLYAVEPALRVDLVDPNADADAPNDRVTTLTGGLNFYLARRAILRVAYERQSLQGADDAVQGVRSQLQVNF